MSRVGGAISRQIWVARGQRGLKWQPGGGAIGEGGSPSGISTHAPRVDAELEFRVFAAQQERQSCGHRHLGPHRRPAAPREALGRLVGEDIVLDCQLKR